jgi:hypothetical protein
MPLAGTDRATPSRWKAALFFLKAWVFRTRRGAAETMKAMGGEVRRLEIARERGTACLGESRAALYTTESPAEFALEAGKVQNLRIAAARLDGLAIPRGITFSFWKQIGRPLRRRGFVNGRELREGCIIPSVGGGLCQLSNALYDAALNAGCEIIERHGHSMRTPGSMAAVGRDATVFWNYVDLRFRAPVDCVLEARLTSGELIVRLCAAAAAGAIAPRAPATPEAAIELDAEAAVESCETCGMTECFRHPVRARGARDGCVTAWLVDAWWPELDEYMLRHRAAGDWLLLPIDSSRHGLGRYHWDTKGWACMRQAPWETLRRSWRSRRLASEGAERQRALLRFDRELAARYMRALPPEALHLVVSQTLLPHLWKAGALGGRTFDVLMTRLPVAALEAALDRAAARLPQCPTLADFRSPAGLAEDEAAALAEARQWITPHGAIAALAGDRAVKLPWKIPARTEAASPGGTDALFAASTLGRKGAYETAAAARALGVRVQLGGSVFEPAECWRGVRTLPASQGWAGVGVAVLPAWVEHQPRMLLKALAAGLPVIATEACGLAGLEGVITTPEGDAEALAAALSKTLSIAQPA